MPNLKWIIKSVNDLPRKKEEDKKELIRFWEKFYSYLLENTNISEQSDKSRSVQYKEEVFDILHQAKSSLPLSDERLRNIQMEIEDLTMLFDEESIFKTTPNIIRILIRNNEVSAKDYLKARLQDKDNIELLSEFGQYTIEALIVHVLSMLFNIYEYNSIIRVASLVEQLELNVRRQASLLKSRRYKKPLSMDDAFQVKRSGKENLKKSKLVMMFPFGTGLVQFMEERGLISFVTDLDFVSICIAEE